jgi:hypothetical protein
MDDPPLRMVIGSDALTAMKGKIKAYNELYSTKRYEDLANSCDVEGYQRPS